MVAYKDQKIGKWWSNESALIEGYLSTNYLKPNQRKDDLDRTTRFYKQLDSALNQIIRDAWAWEKISATVTHKYIRNGKNTNRKP